MSESKPLIPFLACVGASVIMMSYRVIGLTGWEQEVNTNAMNEDQSENEGLSPRKVAEALVEHPGLSGHLPNAFGMPLRRLDSPEEQIFTIGMVNGLLDRGPLFLQEMDKIRLRCKEFPRTGTSSSGIQWPVFLASFGGHMEAFVNAVRDSKIDWHGLEPWRRAQVLAALRKGRGWEALSAQERVTLFDNLLTLKEEDAVPATKEDAPLFARIFTTAFEETRPVFHAIGDSLDLVVNQELLKANKPVDLRFGVIWMTRIRRRLLEKDRECVSYIQTFEWLVRDVDHESFMKLSGAGAEALQSLRQLQSNVADLSLKLGNAYAVSGDQGLMPQHLGYKSWEEAGFSF